MTCKLALSDPLPTGVRWCVHGCGCSGVGRKSTRPPFSKVIGFGVDGHEIVVYGWGDQKNGARSSVRSHHLNHNLCADVNKGGMYRIQLSACFPIALVLISTYTLYCRFNGAIAVCMRICRCQSKLGPNHNCLHPAYMVLFFCSFGIDEDGKQSIGL
jgi:hypothetical protein